MTTETRTLTASIPALDALAAFEQCLVAVADGRDGRPTLTGVHVRADGEGLTFGAADGFQLLRVSVPGANPDRNEWAAILDAVALKAALPAIKTLIKAQKSEPEAERFPVTLTYSEAQTETYDNKRGLGYSGSVTMGAGLSTVTIPTISGTFPEYGQLIPLRDCALGGKAAFNAGYVAKMLTVAAKYAASGIVTQRIQEPKMPMRYDWRPESDPDKATWAATYVLMPMFVRWEGVDEGGTY